MRLTMLGSLPEKPMIALSGGVDSMVVADFISRTREITCLFFHHKTETSEKAHSFLVDYCKSREWYLIVNHLTAEKPKHESYEEFWRNQRYAWFDSFSRTVVTGHHLDDCVETYLWSAMHGTPKTIPYQRNNVVRPFLLTPKEAMYAWANRRGIPWIEDETNNDTSYMRNFVRHELLPKALHVNPGLKKVVARKVKSCYTADLN